MAKRKYSRMSDKVNITHYECTNKKCKWQGTDEQKASQKDSEGWTNLVCPSCFNVEFFGLLPSFSAVLPN